MNKNILIKGCCLWASGLCFGTIVGGYINEKINKKYVESSIEIYRDSSELFRKLLLKQFIVNDQLKKEINKDEA